MKQFSVNDVVGHGSIAEYDRTLDRIKRRSFWVRVWFGIGYSAIAVLNWRNPLLALWIAIAYYNFWNAEKWMIEAFNAYTEYSKDLLRQIEKFRTAKRKLYE